MVGIRFITLILTILFPPVVLAGELTQTLTVESIHVLKIIERDEKATIKLPDGRMHILKVGDELGKDPLRVTGSRLRVVEITEGRIVFEERTEKGPETVIIRFENGEQRIERIRKAGDKAPVLYSPSTKDTKVHEDKR